MFFLKNKSFWVVCVRDLQKFYKRKSNIWIRSWIPQSTIIYKVLHVKKKISFIHSHSHNILYSLTYMLKCWSCKSVSSLPNRKHNSATTRHYIISSIIISNSKLNSNAFCENRFLIHENFHNQIFPIQILIVIAVMLRWRK